MKYLETKTDVEKELKKLCRCPLTIINQLLAVINYKTSDKYVWSEEHKDVSLSCDLNGYPTPVFSWVKNKTVVATGSRTLTLLHVKKNESGFYECWANNTHGYHAHQVELRVESKGSFTLSNFLLSQ